MLHTRYDKTLQIRISAESHVRLVEAAKISNVSVSTLCRWVILKWIAEFPFTEPIDGYK